MAWTMRLRTISRYVLHWDFLVSALFALAFGVFTLSSDRPLEEVTPAVIAAVPLGVTIAGLAAVAERWLADRLKDDAYGKLLRRGDKGEVKARRPYLLVELSGVATSVLALLLLVTRDEFGRTVTTVSWSVLLFLGMFSILGFLDLLLLGRRHARRQAELRAAKEDEEWRRGP